MRPEAQILRNISSEAATVPDHPKPSRTSESCQVRRKRRGFLDDRDGAGDRDGNRNIGPRHRNRRPPPSLILNADAVTDKWVPENAIAVQIKPIGIDNTYAQTIKYSMLSTAKKRTYNLDGELIGLARHVLDARTDTETIQRALRKVVDDAQLERALDALLKEGHFRSIYR